MAKSKFKRQGKSKFIMIDGYVKRCAAWRALSTNDRCAYLELKWRYDGLNNGRIGLGCRELAEELGAKSPNTASISLANLEAKGFIKRAKPSGFSRKDRTATEWRLTEYPCDVTGELPTKDFMRWEHEKKQQSYQEDTQSYQKDSEASETVLKLSDSPTGRTVKPNSPQAQSYQKDTYRYTMGGTTNAA